MQNRVMQGYIGEFISYLEQEERSQATRIQYERELQRFAAFSEREEITKTLVVRYKEMLKERYQSSSINTKLAALNSFFSFIGAYELRVKQVKVQRKVFASEERELTRKEYLRLIQAAKQKKDERLLLLFETICGTGIRVSELRFITAEAVKRGEAEIYLKGKTRVILIPQKLRELLKGYIRSHRISTGPVFVTCSGNPLDRSNIWKMMKQLCKAANVDRKKVFPHNLRHLFARCFYEADKDIARLADVLGHSSINTTRIYIISSGNEHRKRMDALELIL